MLLRLPPVDPAAAALLAPHPKTSAGCLGVQRSACRMLWVAGNVAADSLSGQAETVEVLGA